MIFKDTAEKNKIYSDRGEVAEDHFIWFWFKLSIYFEINNLRTKKHFSVSSLSWTLIFKVFRSCVITSVHVCKGAWSLDGGDQSQSCRKWEADSQDRDSDSFLNFKASSFSPAVMLCIQDRARYNDNVPRFNEISGVLRVALLVEGIREIGQVFDTWQNYM